MTDEHDIHEMVEEMAQRAEEMAARTEAVETLTKESVIADNKKFRRRNTVLLIGIALLLLSQLIQQARYYLDTKPQNDKQTEVLQQLEDNQADLDELVTFVREVRDNPDEPGASREELQAVFDAVFDTKAMIECVLSAPNDQAVRNCVSAES